MESAIFAKGLMSILMGILRLDTATGMGFNSTVLFMFVGASGLMLPQEDIPNRNKNPNK